MIAEQMQKYVEAFEEAGYGAWTNPSGPDNQVAQFFCVVHIDEQDRNFVIQGFYPREMAEAMGVEWGDVALKMLQLTMPLPFPVEESALSETALLLHMLNAVTPVGQFILSEQEQSVSYRAVLPHSDEMIEPSVVLEVVNMAQFFCTEYAQVIEPVAAGTSTHQEVAEAALRAAQNSTS
ncbi:MAG: hypothetical protein ABGZ17_25280 [Planctomycetaceae bacterium]